MERLENLSADARREILSVEEEGIRRNVLEVLEADSLTEFESPMRLRLDVSPDCIGGYPVIHQILRTKSEGDAKNW